MKKTVITILCAIWAFINIALVIAGVGILMGRIEEHVLLGVAIFVVGLLFFTVPFRLVYKINSNRMSYDGN